MSHLFVFVFKQKTAPPPPAQKTAPAPADEDADEEDDFDLFGSDDEVDEEAERLKEQRLQEYTAKKAKKPAIIAKYSILLDVKPVSSYRYNNFCNNTTLLFFPFC